MARESVEIVRAMYESFNGLSESGNFVGHVDSHFDADCVYDPVEESGEVRGRADLVRWNARWFEVWERCWVDVDEVFEAGGRVVTALTLHGRGEASGLEIDQRFFHVFDLRDDRILRIQEFLDREEVLKAVRLRD
jgi:ketosteroid isomerase-like protein